jgi:hypothetical protein
MDEQCFIKSFFFASSVSTRRWTAPLVTADTAHGALITKPVVIKLGVFWKICPFSWYSENQSAEIQNFKNMQKKLNPLRRIVVRKFNKNDEYCTVKKFAEVKTTIKKTFGEESIWNKTYLAWVKNEGKKIKKKQNFKNRKTYLIPFPLIFFGSDVNQRSIQHWPRQPPATRCDE